MKVVQINAVYGVGSTGKTTRELHNRLLKKGYESYVMWSSKCSNPQEKGLYRIHNKIGSKVHAVLERLFATQCFHSYFCTKKAIKILSNIKPDVVHLRNLHSNFINFSMLLKYLAKEKIPVVITLHDCWTFTGGCFHFKLKGCDGYAKKCENCPDFKNPLKRNARKLLLQKKKKLYSSLSSFAIVGVSKWVSESAKKSAVFNEKTVHEYIYNWIDLDIFRPFDDIAKVKQKYNLTPDTKIVLGVAQSWKSDKGLELFKKLSEKVDENTKIILVGTAKGVSDTENLKFIGRTESVSELVELYSAADLFVNPSPAETFGKVTAEALACGTQVVAYNNTGTAELVPDFCGKLVEDQNEEKMIETVLETLNLKNNHDREKQIAFVKENFDFQNQSEKYIQLYKKLTNK